MDILEHLSCPEKTVISLLSQGNKPKPCANETPSATATEALKTKWGMGASRVTDSNLRTG
eukprot:5851932-Amphidinium_carterae.1